MGKDFVPNVDAFSAHSRGVLLESEAKVLKTISTTHDFHPQIPFIIPIQYRLDKMRLPVSDVKKHTIIFSDPHNLITISICL
jgi:hypothetical protein